MKRFRLLSLAAMAGAFLALAAPSARAQISFGVQIGPAPVCPYGYYNYSPYNCAPFGYYGPDWFRSGAFIGTGPWYNGPANFNGWVNRRYDPHYGYRGSYPPRGQRPDWGRHRGWERNFHGNHQRHETRRDNDNRNQNRGGGRNNQGRGR